MRKILDGLAVASFVLAAGLTGSAIWGYRWATNPKTHEMLKEKAIEAVSGSLPIPGDLTGPAIPTAKPKLPF